MKTSDKELVIWLHANSKSFSMTFEFKSFLHQAILAFDPFYYSKHEVVYLRDVSKYIDSHI